MNQNHTLKHVAGVLSRGRQSMELAYSEPSIFRTKGAE
jgi:hypothetical protein